MTKFVSVLLVTASILNAGYDLEIVKASREIKIEKPSSIKIDYRMHEMMKKGFKSAAPSEFNKRGIQLKDDALIEIVIMPVQFGDARFMGRTREENVNGTPIKNTQWTPPQEVNQTVATPNVNLQGSAKKTFLDGVAQPGSQGSYSTMAQGVGNMVTVGLINVALGSIGYGVDYLWTASDKYCMATDVTINGERTRIFAMIKDGSTIKNDEAILELSRLTLEKISQMLGENK